MGHIGAEGDEVARTEHGILISDDAPQLTGQRFIPNSDVLIGLNCEVDEQGWATTDKTGRTSVAGVWAAGNVIDPRAQVITAAGAGSAAAIAINADLVEEDIRNAVSDLKHGLQFRTTATTHQKESS